MHLLSGVWIGFDADRALGSFSGGRVATPIWTAFMTCAREAQPERDFGRPDNVAVVQVDAATGLKAVPGRTARTEVFLTGTEPNLFAPSSTPTPEVPDGFPGSPSTDY